VTVDLRDLEVVGPPAGLRRKAVGGRGLAAARAT